MLHTKFRENRPAGSGEEDFWRVFTIYGRGGHLGHVTQMPRTKYRSPYPRRLHIKFGFDRPSGFGEEDIWNCLRRTDDGRRRTTTTDDGRTPDHEYPISSPMSLWLRWAKYGDKLAKPTFSLWYASQRHKFECDWKTVCPWKLLQSIEYQNLS